MALSSSAKSGYFRRSGKGLNSLIHFKFNICKVSLF